MIFIRLKTAFSIGTFLLVFCGGVKPPAKTPIFQRFALDMLLSQQNKNSTKMKIY